VSWRVASRLSSSFCHLLTSDDSAFGQETFVKWPVFLEALKEYLQKEHGVDKFDVATEDRVHFIMATLALKAQAKDEVCLSTSRICI
jgi:hypothetical protein